jgi:tetratricopeptide (TPR) repeat protein
MDYRASRVRAQSYTDSPEKFDADAESWLDYVEKTVGTCQRDVLYMRAALGINYRKNYKRVEELISKIEGEKRADDIRQVMLKDRTFNDIESGELDQAESRIKKLSDPRVRSIVQISLAEAYLKKGQTSDSIKLANAATDTIDKLPEPGDRAGLLFALAAVRLKGDPVDALAILSKAVKQLNKLDPQDKMSFEIMLRISLSCEGDTQRNWWGDGMTLPNSNLFDATALFAKDNPDSTNSAVDSVNDKVMRLRGKALVAKTAIANLKLKVPVP